jgi:hypothetical protein
MLLAASALVSVGGMQEAHAQTQETSIEIDNFFMQGGELHNILGWRWRSEMQAGAQERLKAALDVARRCPSYTVVRATNISGDNTPAQWDNDPARERRLTLETAVNNAGGGANVESDVSSPSQSAIVWVKWTLAPDEEKPKLDVVWTPSKGTPVKIGDTITAHVTARDDATAAQTTPAQTGVARVRVDVGIGGGLVAAPAEYAPPMPLQECGRQNPVRSYEATYTVTPDAPPVVKLRAYAKDFAGNETWEDAEFPLQADWHGTFEMVSFDAVRNRFRSRADIVLNHDGRGNLTGTMAGQHEHVDFSSGGCTYRQIQPNRFRVSLVGSISERSSPAEGPTLKVFIGEIEETALKAVATCEGGTGGPIGPPGGWKFKIGVFPPEVLLGTPGPFGEGEVLADGTRQYKLVSETGGAGTRWTVTLRRARN